MKEYGDEIAVERRRVTAGAVRLAVVRRASHTGFGNLKTWLQGTFHGVSPKHLQRYLDEFVYRFNRRWREDALSGFVLRRTMQARPFPYCRLTAEPVG